MNGIFLKNGKEKNNFEIRFFWWKRRGENEGRRGIERGSKWI